MVLISTIAWIFDGPAQPMLVMAADTNRAAAVGAGEGFRVTGGADRETCGGAVVATGTGATELGPTKLGAIVVGAAVADGSATVGTAL